MRLIKVFVFSLFLFYACQTRPHKYIDPLAQPYLIRFLELCDLYKVNCTDWKHYSISVVEFKPSYIERVLNIITPSTIGLCNHFKKTIEIKKEWFDVVYGYSMYEDIESVMFHEFGHCILKKKHTEEGLNTIMSPTAIGWGYVAKYQKLMDEFFGCQTNCPEVRFELNRYYKRKVD
jgi:hypothetical protein